MLVAKETAVVSPVGQGNDGGAMNLNADVAAAALAGALQAEQMVFLSDVPGLMKDVKDAKSLIREIRAGELEKLEKEGVISGGMIPKCRSAAAALKQGLKAVFAEGFRVTDGAAMAVVEEVLDRKVNPGIVAKLNGLGGKYCSRCRCC